VQHAPGVRRQGGQPPADRIGESRRDLPVQRATRGPPAVVLDQRSPGDQSGEQLLDQKRQAVGVGAEECLDRSRQGRGGQARPSQAEGRLVVQSRQLDRPRRAPRDQRVDQTAPRAALVRPECDQADEAFRGQIVRQIFHNRQ
jgi:hypothetical protein